MQTKTDSLAKHPRTSAASAANEDFCATTTIVTTEKVAGPLNSGWDPYEVWRTRVKATQRDSSSEITLGH